MRKISAAPREVSFLEAVHRCVHCGREMREPPMQRVGNRCRACLPERLAAAATPPHRWHQIGDYVVAIEDPQTPPLGGGGRRTE